MSIVGKVEDITTRKFGEKTMYNAKVDGEWFGLAGFKPQFVVGDTISFEFIQKGQFRNMDTSTISISEPAPEAPKTVVVSKDDYWKNKEAQDENKQHAIMYQAAKNAAISIVGAMLQKDLVKLPSKEPVTAVLALVDEITDRYYIQSELAYSGNYDPEVPPDMVPFEADKKNIKDQDD